MVSVRFTQSNDEQKWNEYVLSHGSSGPYHLFSWIEAVKRAYYHDTYCLMAEDDKGKVCGVLPLTLIKPPFLKAYLVSLPFCDYGGVLSQDKEVADLLIKSSLNLARSLKSRLEIRCKVPNPSLHGFPGLKFTSHKVRMLLHLPEGSDILWNSFKSKLRSQIRRPQKDGMEFKLGSKELLDDFYDIFSLNMKELGSPVHAKTWIASVLDTYAGRAHVGMVYKEATAVAGGIIIDHKDTVSVPWASSLSEYSRSSPNMLLYWGLLQYASNNGFKFFDFGRSGPGEGTYIFKKQWGAEPEPLYWYSEGTDDAQNAVAGSNNIRQTMEAIWSKLPRAVVNSLGPRIRGYITL